MNNLDDKITLFVYDLNAEGNIDGECNQKSYLEVKTLGKSKQRERKGQVEREVKREVEAKRNCRGHIC